MYKPMKTNVSIKFNSVEEYREIEKKLLELGYWSDKEWNEDVLKDFKLELCCLRIYDSYKFSIQYLSAIKDPFCIFYNSLQEFLNDN